MESLDLQVQSFGEKLLDMITLEFALKFFVIYFFVVWIALIIWVIKDISVRTNSIFFQIISVLVILFLTPLGIFVYLIIRPRRTLYDKYYEEIEENLEIINELVEERKKQVEESFKKQKIPRKINSLQKVELIQKEVMSKITNINSMEEEKIENQKNTLEN